MININDFINAMSQKQIQSTPVITPRGKGIEFMIKGKPMRALLLYYSDTQYFTLEIASGQVIDPDNFFETRLLLKDISDGNHHRYWRILDTGYVITQAHYYTDDLNELIKLTMSRLKLISNEFIMVIPIIMDFAQGRKTIFEATRNLQSLGLLK
jgi:hypothetical protein